jgi:MoaA/NifB/PqqE/SkfB family radical SAM enzyme
MFSMQQKRVVAICEEIVRRDIRVHWKCETRVDCLDEATIEAMARSGCVGVNFGVESIDPDVQKGVHRKPITEEDFVETVALLHKHGISTFAFFVVGLPGDTLETILRSIEFAVRIKAKWTQFTVATPFVGTPMHKWAVEQGFVAPDFYKIVNAHTMSPGNETLQPMDIERLHRFSKFLQNNLLNRRGILKNERRLDPPYAALRAAADAVSYAAAIGLVRIAARYYRQTVRPVPPDSRRLTVVQPRPAG